jgi:hypothetical protein
MSDLNRTFVNISDSLQSQTAQSIQQRVNAFLGMLLMFGACLLVCHSFGFIHAALEHFSS